MAKYAVDGSAGRSNKAAMSAGGDAESGGHHGAAAEAIR
jgi:hypothetical protein